MDAQASTALYPIESAVGRALEQAQTDQDGYQIRRLTAVSEALSKVRTVCDGAKLSEREEKHARELLLDIADHSVWPLSNLALQPFVAFVRSCKTA